MSELVGKMLVALLVAALGAVSGLYVWRVQQIDQLRVEIHQLQDDNEGLRAALEAKTHEAELLQKQKEAACKSLMDPGNTVTPDAREACGIAQHVTITQPKDGDKVGLTIVADGTVDKSWLNGRTLWFAVTSPGNNLYWIQGDATQGEATITEDGRWISPTLYLGGEAQNVGRSFAIIAIVADAQAGATLTAKVSDNVNEPIALPNGAQEVMRVNVTRT